MNIYKDIFSFLWLSTICSLNPTCVDWNHLPLVGTSHSSVGQDQVEWSRRRANDVKSTCTSCPIFPRKPLMIPLFLGSCKTFFVCFCCWKPHESLQMVQFCRSIGTAQPRRSEIKYWFPRVSNICSWKKKHGTFVYNELANIPSVWTNHHDHHDSGGCDFDHHLVSPPSECRRMEWAASWPSRGTRHGAPMALHRRLSKDVCTVSTL